ncbi:MAG: tRNA 2-thiocytidine biosynthesis TtcA family protein [Synergistota bacterium]|nr:tRNA 2-thiocytidine biosynthesis TtcA family protein [Synergistota bacterium]OPZ35935.1 MAG: tRNA 2-thiocytidine biosynthesis protein TtcA [Synergistetes bacterium ADurb.BinA166]
MAFKSIPPVCGPLKKKIGLAISEYRMIQHGDRIMIGLSGGKDSLVLALALAGLRSRSPVGFDLSACTVDITGGEVDLSPLRTFCSELDISYSCRPYPIVDIIKNRGERSPCSLCANIRRGILNTAARESGCGSLALGHTLDDAVETALMNLFNNGRFKSFQPKQWQSRSGVTVIRPLILAEERRVTKEAARLSLPVTPYICPFSVETERSRTKRAFAHLSAGNPKVKYNVAHALKCIDEADRWGAEADRDRADDDPS